MKEAFGDDGIVENSGPYSRLSSEAARQQMSEKAEEDGFGDARRNVSHQGLGCFRQRYWGTPIPVIHCPKCGVVPVPENDLPVLLPLNVAITGTGRSPLEKFRSSSTSTCPKCGGPARVKRTRWTRSSIRRGTSTDIAI